MTDSLAGSTELLELPNPLGGALPSSSGSSESLGSDGAADALVCPVCAKEFQGRAGLVSHVRNRHPGTELPAPPVTPSGQSTEQRPQGDGKRSRWGWSKARTRREKVGPPPARPRARRVSLAPTASSLVAFGAGGLERLGQGPLARIAGFTSPAAGAIIDDALAGTVVDRIAQPLVRGSEKYSNLGALVACYASVAWASNNPENAEPAYAMFRWSMTVLLPITGEEMVKRAKEEREAAEKIAALMPELAELGLGPDPIATLWAMMWTEAPAPPAPEPAEAPVA